MGKNIFISYSHTDEDYKKQFLNHLSGIKKQGHTIWNDRDILIGDKWDAEIKEKLRESDIVIFLISSDFLSSEYINEVEIKETIERHRMKEVYIA